MRGIKSPQKENHSRFGTHTHTGESAYFVLFCFFFHFLPTVYYYFWFYYAARFISIIDCWRAAVTTNSSQKEKKKKYPSPVCVCVSGSGGMIRKK
jgi:hypothetical protein